MKLFNFLVITALSSMFCFIFVPLTIATVIVSIAALIVLVLWPSPFKFLVASGYLLYFLVNGITENAVASLGMLTGFYLDIKCLYLYAINKEFRNKKITFEPISSAFSRIISRMKIKPTTNHIVSNKKEVSQVHGKKMNRQILSATMVLIGLSIFGFIVYAHQYDSIVKKEKEENYAFVVKMVEPYRPITDKNAEKAILWPDIYTSIIARNNVEKYKLVFSKIESYRFTAEKDGNEGHFWRAIVAYDNALGYLKDYESKDPSFANDKLFKIIKNSFEVEVKSLRSKVEEKELAEKKTFEAKRKEEVAEAIDCSWASNRIKEFYKTFKSKKFNSLKTYLAETLLSSPAIPNVESTIPHQEISNISKDDFIKFLYENENRFRRTNRIYLENIVNEIIQVDVMDGICEARINTETIIKRRDDERWDYKERNRIKIKMGADKSIFYISRF